MGYRRHRALSVPPAIVRDLPVVVADGTCPLTREELGGKAWGVNRMRALGLPVPPAIVLTTRAYRAFRESGDALDAPLWEALLERLAVLESQTGRRFGDSRRPLLVAVRSGAAHSMPGMMDTILNLGINPTIAGGLAVATANAGFADTTLRVFRDHFRKVVLGGAPGEIPDDPRDQLRAAVGAVFSSWNSPRARAYRRDRGLRDDDGTAVTVQAMVFGNLDALSGTGVLFSRNPVTGEHAAWGEWLGHAQGEEVVSGKLTPQSLEVLHTRMPDVHEQLLRDAAILEADARDVQDIEFTVESGHLWFLQSRVAKRSPSAAVRLAVALAEEGLITTREALDRVGPDQARNRPARRLSPAAERTTTLASGVPACPGIATGVVVTSADQAESIAVHGGRAILARTTTSPEDLAGIIAAAGIMTEQGGATSHAAVISRELGRPCIVGCGPRTVTTLAGRHVTLDGTTGRIWDGDLTGATGQDTPAEAERKLLGWGLPLLPVALLAAEDAPAEIVDLDALGKDWRAGLTNGVAVRGEVLDTTPGIRTALAAGVGAAVVRDRLAAMLACLQAPRHTETSASNGVDTEHGEGRPDGTLSLLRLLDLKGRADTAILADALGMPTADAATRYGLLADRGWCRQAGDLWRLTGPGREHLLEALARERSAADADAVANVYEAFSGLNGDLKRIITDWQLRADGTPNDHRDADYDRAIVGRLADLHARATPLLGRLGAIASRLANYGVRLDRAAARVVAGDRERVARIVAESYHTIWFELHTDLLTLAGRQRERE
ncbi:MAG: pyruvate, phosphate dikinase [Betaproteobacteria bacterium]|nr:pyruvate, phosphate dikinase [Betaproteobacteria bacterium]